VAASALQPKSVLLGGDALSPREFAQLSIIGALVLLSPVLALLAAIAVEIAIDILLQAGGPRSPSSSRLVPSAGCCCACCGAAEGALRSRREKVR